MEDHPNSYVSENLSHSWVTPLKNCLDVVFEQWFNQESFHSCGTVHSKDSNWIGLSEGHGTVLPKGR